MDDAAMEAASPMDVDAPIASNPLANPVAEQPKQQKNQQKNQQKPQKLKQKSQEKQEKQQQKQQKKDNIQHREVFQRLNFLHQAAFLMTLTSLAPPSTPPVPPQTTIVNQPSTDEQARRIDPTEWKMLTKGKRKQLRRKLKRQTLQKRQAQHAATHPRTNLAGLGSHFAHQMKRCAQKFVIRMYVPFAIPAQRGKLILVAIHM